VAQVFAGHDFPGVFQKHREDEEGLFLKFDWRALPGERALGQIHLKKTKPTDL